MPGLAGENLGAGDALVLGLVGEHRTGDHVADGVDALHAGGEMRIDLHAAAIVERDAGFLEAEALGVGHAADADHDHVGFQRFGSSTRGRLDLRRQRLARGVDAGDLGAELERKALLFEDALELLGDFAVHAGQDAVEKLHHGDLGAEPVPHRAELEPDHAGADDQ